MTIDQSLQRSRWSWAFDRARLITAADWLAAALAASLPWSTSATSILLALWLLAFLPTLDKRMLWRALCSPAGALPVLLVLMLAIGMAWASDASVADRLGGVKSMAKLLVIPLLMAHYQVSERGAWVLKGFLISCGVLLALSWLLYILPDLPWAFASKKGHWAGVPVKDTIAQANEFSVCVFLLAPLALIAAQQRQRGLALSIVAVALVFAINVLAIAVSRTALLVLPVLLLIFVFRQLSARQSMAIALLALIALGSAAALLPTVRDNVSTMLREVQDFQPGGERTRAGERLEFWRKSAEFIKAAPVLGHGTGSIRELYRRSAEGQEGMAGLATANPHNQTLTIAVQLGAVGALALWAMWAAHFLLFWRDGLVAWAGLVVTAQNIVSSLFNSHLLDFTQGWGYVIGVGVAGGMILKHQRSAGGNDGTAGAGA